MLHVFVALCNFFMNKLLWITYFECIQTHSICCPHSSWTYKYFSTSIPFRRSLTNTFKKWNQLRWTWCTQQEHCLQSTKGYENILLVMQSRDSLPVLSLRVHKNSLWNNKYATSPLSLWLCEGCCTIRHFYITHRLCEFTVHSVSDQGNEGIFFVKDFNGHLLCKTRSPPFSPCSSLSLGGCSAR